MTKQEKDALVRRYIVTMVLKGLATKEVGRIMRKENPGIWPSDNAAQKAINYRTGSDGQHQRKHLRDKSLVKQLPEISINTSDVLRRIGEAYTPQELSAIAAGGRLMPGYARVPVVNFEGTHIRIGAITDTHIGSKFFQESRLMQAFEQFQLEGVDFVTHSGDVTEGMSNRPGHVYELDFLGYAQQKDEAVRLLSQWPGQIFMIDGNHDRWYLKSNGAKIVQDIARYLPHAEYLGHDEGDISLGGKAVLKLWHGEDGNSYATSYRIQKVIESLSGGEKPSVMFFGHTHKHIHMFERNVHCFSIGCIESQSSWMRSKRIAAHTGFWVIDIWVNSQGVSKAGGIFYPFYT